MSAESIRGWGLACFVCAVCVPSAWCQEWAESFERGLGSAKPYHRDGSTAQLAIESDKPADGRQFLRAMLPGTRALEGVNVTATALSGGRVAIVTAKVRGRGRIWLCLISANGWLYSPDTVQLTDRWQTISLCKALMVSDKTLGIHFLGKDVQPDAIFELDDVRVTLAESPIVYDAEVGPRRFEAENFAQRHRDVTEDESASGGRTVSSGQYCRLMQMPFPRTSRPVTVYLRVNAGSRKEAYRLLTTQGGQTQVLSTAEEIACGARPRRAPGSRDDRTTNGASPTREEHWRWFRFRRFTQVRWAIISTSIPGRPKAPSSRCRLIL